MKHFVLIALFSLLTTVASAAENPLDKGSVILEGSAFFTSQSGDAYIDSKTIIVNPGFSYFVSPGTFVGGLIQYGWYEVGSSSVTEYSLGPVLGYYFNTNKERPEPKGAAYPFVMAFAAYGGFDSELTLIQFGGQAGVTLMASNAVGVTFEARLSHDIWDSDEADSRSGLTFQIGFGLTSFIY
ncbi:MAG: hypothetical protein JSU74_01660 [Candidatus Zixiibacteriota bacterium]|nr:MAG: hypothetical protein JSU74_01660 [candidate division Zixibacteria bacterium]